MLRRNIITTLSVAGALMLSACGGPAPEQAAEAEGNSDTDQANEVTIAMVTSSCLGFFPPYVAQEEGFFDEQGVSVNIEVVNGSSAVLQAMLSGQANLGTPGPLPVIQAQSRGEDVKYVANVSPGGNFMLVAPNGEGITDAGQLEGKTIGVATADGGEVSFLDTIMRASGLEEGSYEVMTVGEGGQAVAGFTRGDIDAYSASIDGVATIEQAGIELTDISGDSTNYLFGNGLVAEGDFIESNGDAIAAVGRAYNQATQFGLENPDAVIETCGKYQPQEVEDTEYATALLEASRTTVTSPEGADFGYSNPEYWEMLIADAEASGEIQADAVQAEDLFTNEFVEEYTP